WPNGSVIREQQNADDRRYSENKWVWTSRGNSYRQERVGHIRHRGCEAKVFLYKIRRDGRDVKINPILANPRAARHAVETSKSRLGLVPHSVKGGGLATLRDVSGLHGKLGMRFIVDSSFSGPTYFALETPFILEIIQESVGDWLSQDESGPDAGRHGFCTDGDHSFFRMGNLLATCAFSTVLAQWVPVGYTWILSLDTDHHRVHFRRLNKHILAATPEARFHPKYLAAVMDFSQAQRSAHASKYVDAMTSRILGFDILSSEARNVERSRLLVDVSKYQQGCEVHFQRSAMRLKKDSLLVPPHLRDTFQECVNVLLRTRDRNEYEQTMARLRSNFPSVMQGWISWWARPHISAMIFPACYPGDANEADNFRDSEIPHTSNPIETQHSLLHRATGKGCDLIPGIEALFAHVKQLKIQYDAAKKGHYHPSGPRSKSNRIPTVRFDIGDGRAPDTYDTLARDTEPNVTFSAIHFAVGNVVRDEWGMTDSRGYASALSWFPRAIEDAAKNQISSLFGLQHESVVWCSSGHVAVHTHSGTILQLVVTVADTTVMNLCTAASVLTVIPETRNDTPEAFKGKTGSTVTYPLRFSLPASFGPHEVDRLRVPESGLVEYQLVGRVLYERGVASAHYTAQVVIGDSAYDYDSTYSNGRLYSGYQVDAEPAESHRRRASITTPTQNHSMAIYHRGSDISTTFRSVSSILSSLDVYSRHPKPRFEMIEVFSDHDSPQSQPVRRRRPTPRKHKSHSSMKSFLSQSSIDDYNCAVCKTSRPPILADPRLPAGRRVVGCSKCNKWSHQDCIEEQFGLPSNVEDPDVRWLCPYCSQACLWNDDMCVTGPR
ncbi:hypothetical protein LXA43DRAFT_893128, partial [Ganoderma leucocontextum]